MDTSDAAPILEEFVPNSRTLYVIFGGLSGGLAMPRFEFYRSMRIVNDNKLFVRDFSQSWYQSGLPGIAENVYELAGHLQDRIDALGPERTLFIGNSMGGYAAILFASLLRQGTAIAFAPQTFLSPLKRLTHRDFRWRRRVWATYRRCLWKPGIFDLEPLVASAPETDVHIFVSRDCRLDIAHAACLERFANVTVTYFTSGGHGLVRHLRDSGELSDVLRAA